MWIVLGSIGSLIAVGLVYALVRWRYPDREPDVTPDPARTARRFPTRQADDVRGPWVPHADFDWATHPHRDVITVVPFSSVSGSSVSGDLSGGDGAGTRDSDPAPSSASNGGGGAEGLDLSPDASIVVGVLVAMLVGALVFAGLVVAYIVGHA